MATVDAEVLSRAQDSGARVRAGGVTGLVDGFRTGKDGWMRLRDSDGQLHEVQADTVEVVDAIDEGKVHGAREARRVVDETFMAEAGRPNRAAILAALRSDPQLLDQLATLVAERRPPAGTKEAR